jgi:hypothetical protein
MGNRRFERYEYQQAIASLRLGPSNREVARAGFRGWRKAAELWAIALSRGWLDPAVPLPEAQTLAEVFGKQEAKPDPLSSILPYREEVKSWWEQGICGTTIHDALTRKHGCGGSYSAVRRFLQTFKKEHPQATVMLDLEPGEAAQVDFGSGPRITDPPAAPRHPTQRQRKSRYVCETRKNMRKMNPSEPPKCHFQVDPLRRSLTALNRIRLQELSLSD